ncbi:MAG: AbrB/MazE/SpoVT family DNA-binding domain-containing protein [Oscillospiraceae bacterium]|nr:AbrB/MazE/SpoVT family DNA-binding domain-containing protein [Oscillospiraceae bacterium]
MNRKHKRLSKGRGVTIPRDMAAYLGLEAGTAVDLTATGDGRLIISKHADTCRFCGGTERIKYFSGIFCCPHCAKALYEEVCS